jgi:hypothetical protein
MMGRVMMIVFIRRASRESFGFITIVVLTKVVDELTKEEISARRVSDPSHASLLTKYPA